MAGFLFHGTRQRVTSEARSCSAQHLDAAAHRDRLPGDGLAQIAKTAEYKRSRRLRKKVEILFAHLKRILKLDRPLLCDNRHPIVKNANTQR